MPDRRRYERRSCAELVNICTPTRKDRIGLVRDLSPTGLRLQSSSRFTVGERLELQLRISSIKLAATGRVVRTLATPDFESMFPHGTVVELDAPRFDLIEPLTAHADRTSALEIAKLI